ncbi:BTB/POZ fold domain containing protein [Hirsutella rhossiliensis]|uniref:BTB/POZ fold domain containing protein n=1 Tax=Hirsutella rhossiliensis TaxID=111463 RepID=A0A9P8MSY0_9HYPO|nr:BTB/POZ fold domain containing protein [Hirsutella rhossiliensis]KAH0960842.1 BTB/POZ fold domain containing protein [Hirsutella rhossiliensis]
MASASPSDALSDGHGSTPNTAGAAAMRPPRPLDRATAKIPDILPHSRVFPIQIGSELFKLSGASICSDAPSYFSQYFLCQLKAAEEHGEDMASAIRTLYIDRDPATFRDIVLHLQGYHLAPRDAVHFVRLFVDAQFYSLPKLTSQLFEESIFISIGHREFRIPRDLLTSPTNSPNYFSLGFAAFFCRPDNVFPGLDRETMVRPPAILPPTVPNRSADTFAELLRLLGGYPVRIRDEAHRQELLRDARYFHFKGLEQQLIPHAISFNPLRRRDEIALRLENVQKSGVSVVQEPDAEATAGHGGVAWVNYARPYVDDRPAELVLEIGGDATTIHLLPDGPRADFFRDTRARVAKLLEVLATKLNLPPTTQPLGLLMASGGASSQPATPGNTPLSDDLVRVSLGPDAALVLDGKPLSPAAAQAAVQAAGSTGRGSDDAGGSDPVVGSWKRKRAATTGPEETSWSVKTGQWRLRIQGTKSGKSAVECVFVAVKLDAVSSELGRNVARGFLGS